MTLHTPHTASLASLCTGHPSAAQCLHKPHCSMKPLCSPEGTSQGQRPAETESPNESLAFPAGQPAITRPDGGKGRVGAQRRVSLSQSRDFLLSGNLHKACWRGVFREHGGYRRSRHKARKRPPANFGAEPATVRDANAITRLIIGIHPDLPHLKAPLGLLPSQ